MRLSGKVAVITGAARGFGAGIAEVFAREGARLVLTDIDGEGVAKLAEQLSNQAIALQADVTNARDWKMAVDMCVTNSAGSTLSSTMPARPTSISRCSTYPSRNSTAFSRLT
jgi:NAD(P)-dependent dehydrogenase (short-subunit alcohol dehydrogenase family)